MAERTYDMKIRFGRLGYKRLADTSDDLDVPAAVLVRMLTNAILSLPQDQMLAILMAGAAGEKATLRPLRDEVPAPAAAAVDAPTLCRMH